MTARPRSLHETERHLKRRIFPISSQFYRLEELSESLRLTTRPEEDLSVCVDTLASVEMTYVVKS